MHTQGPWEVMLPNPDGKPWVRGPVTDDTDFRRICTMADWDIEERVSHNADLIALAPTAPHPCAPDCPGEINRRMLAHWDELEQRADALESELQALLRSLRETVQVLRNLREGGEGRYAPILDDAEAALGAAEGGE